MKITITIETSGDETIAVETGPQGADALIEHADHDSTPHACSASPQTHHPRRKND